MRARKTILEIFSTFLYFEGDTIGKWIRDGRLHRSIQNCLEQEHGEISPRFWALYWHRSWQVESSQIASNHLTAYLQEVCYWSAQKLSINSSSGQSIADFFQIAIVRIDRVLKGFNPHHGTELSSYASLAFTNAIKDTLRQRQEVEICTDWALLHKVSQKRLGDALQHLGFNSEQIAVYHLAWQCLKTIYAPTDGQGPRKLGQPNLEILTAVANLYDRERYSLKITVAPVTSPAEICQWLTTCGAAVRAYLYPTLISASQSPPNSAGGEFLDHFASTFQPSLLTQIIEDEAAIDRVAQRSQLQQVLLRTLIKFDVESQRLLQMYYGQELTQQEIAKQLATKQYTVSRRLTYVRQSLLKALSQWSQSVLHQSLDTNVINQMSITIEEWLKVHYGTPDL